MTIVDAPTAPPQGRRFAATAEPPRRHATAARLLALILALAAGGCATLPGQGPQVGSGELSADGSGSGPATSSSASSSAAAASAPNADAIAPAEAQQLASTAPAAPWPMTWS